MAYYNGFPATYTSPYTQFAPVQPQSQPVQSSVQGNLIWVQGEAGAKSYLVAPNNTVQLWDSENPVIYLKSADASGLPSMKVLDYTIRDSAKNPPNSLSSATKDNLPVYATKDEIQAVSDQISALRERVDKLARKKDDDE